LTGDPESLNETYRTYEQVTPADVQRVAKKYFAPENRTVVTLLSEKDAAARGAAQAKPEATAAPTATAAQPAATPSAKAPVVRAAKVPAATTPANKTAKAAQDKSPLVSLRIAFRAGSQDDPPGKEGLASLTARMLAEGGSRDVPYAELLEKLYPL